ncbi:MAG: hypothetical protein WA192_04025, partial [Candidatus Acidiferrales bacterium]
MRIGYQCGIVRSTLRHGREIFAGPARMAVGLLLAGALSPFVVCAQTPEAPPAAAPAEQVPVMEADPSAHLLESGYQHLYELNFVGARADFQAYQKARPEDPLGKASEAASYLFEQFHQRGVLTSEFFVNDQTFLGGVPGSAEQNRNAGFVIANNQARAQAKKLLQVNPHDI